MKVGSISYTNTTPFFYQWPQGGAFELLQLPPKQLAEAAERGEIVAGPFPITETWKMEDQFEPLENWGIAVKDASRSVFLLSRWPLSHLNNKKIGVTTESSASVRLLQLLTQQRHGHINQFKRGLDDDADAWLVIGDQALKFWKTTSPQWACITDLATEWWNWKKLPFVFARWMVRKDLDPVAREQLVNQLRDSLTKGLAHLRDIADEQGKRLSLPLASVKLYLEGFRYTFGEEEIKSMAMFRQMAEKLETVEVG